jgi:FemAB-related protein (PEP-CTERM system-associated)
MDVKTLQDQDRELWDNYVRGSDLCTYSHLSGWHSVWTATMGCRARYLLATERQRAVGVLPLLHVRSRLSGHFMISLPGGLCADDEAAAGSLLTRAKELLAETGAHYLVLRDGLRRWDLPGLHATSEHCTFRINLSDGLDRARARLGRSTRGHTNRAMRSGLVAGSAQYDLRHAYPVFARAMRERGTPTLGRRFFAAAMRQFPRDFRLLTASHESVPVGVGFMARLRDTVYTTWAGLPREYYRLRSSHALWWGAIEYAAQIGGSWLDMGRCLRGSGGYTFKERWGGEERTLFQHHYSPGHARPPRAGEGLLEDRRYQLFSQVWQRFPLWLTEALGPWLRRRMPFG